MVATAWHAIACICDALAVWKVQAWIASFMASGVSRLMGSGVQARANSRCAQDKMTAYRKGQRTDSLPLTYSL